MEETRSEISRGLSILKTIGKPSAKNNPKKKSKPSSKPAKFEKSKREPEKVLKKKEKQIKIKNFNRKKSKKRRIFTQEANLKPNFTESTHLKANHFLGKEVNSVFSPGNNQYKKPTPIVAIDCEMVECSGEKKLAR